MQTLDEFRGFVKADEPLAPLTWFRLGGPADFLARPQTSDQLRALVIRCHQESIPFRILSSGSNVLVQDSGVRGVVIQLESPAFSDVRVDGQTVEAGAAVPLNALISQTARTGLSGLEVLTGIPGTVGGALRGNSGTRQGAIGHFVQSVTVIDRNGDVVTREKDDLSFSYRWSNLDDPIIISARFRFESEDPEAVVRRMRRIWIVKKENQPYGHQLSGMIFKDPATDISARMLIDQAGLKGSRVGAAEISDRDSNFIVAQPGATASDVLSLIELVRKTVADTCVHELALQIQVW